MKNTYPCTYRKQPPLMASDQELNLVLRHTESDELDLFDTVRLKAI
jgi:hypothetical protein